MAAATITCPACGKSQSVPIPEDTCVAFHRCTACGALITPQNNDCCVVCSYSDVRCPVSVRAA